MRGPLTILLVLLYPGIPVSRAYEPTPSSCCLSGNRQCCDPCTLDPPEECPEDPLKGIPTDDDSLIILTGLQWPRRDVQWYLEAFKKINNDFKDIQLQTDDNGFSTETLFSQREENVQMKKSFPVIQISVACGSLDEGEMEEVTNFANNNHLDFVLQIMQQDTSQTQEEAMNMGIKALEERHSIELTIRDANITFTLDDRATLLHQLGFRKTDPISTQMAQVGLFSNEATATFMKMMGLPREVTVALGFIEEIPFCKKKFQSMMRPNLVGPCIPNNPYRTIDGSCNNIIHELWGASFTPFRRELPADYGDGTSSLRESMYQGPLPNARSVSFTVNSATSSESPSFTILHMTYGQFLDHDLTATPLARASFSGYGLSESPVKCCNTPFFHPECAPIYVPKNDPFYPCFNEWCLEFVRSAQTDADCLLGQRQQTNEHTAYLDGSVIYGVQPSEVNELRSHMNGLLKYQLSQDDQILLPRDTSDADECNTEENMENGEFCFKAGDGRVNEQILLTFFQTVWAREHNRVATILRNLNGDWDDEELFQEARRIVGAELQQVTYSEFLPTVIGPTLMTTSKLYPLEGSQQTTDYDEHISAGIANAFSTAAFRFGHSLVADNLLYVTKEGKVSVNELSTLFFNPFDLYRRNGMCEVGRGGISRPEASMDSFFSMEISGKLFRGDKPFGLDLVSLNIQRGRDHGIPGYNAWREFCGLPRATSFQDLSDVMSQERIDTIQQIYWHIDDIDLYVGGTSETPLPGAVVGHTFSCIIHNQFYRIKYGDRYWFEYRDGPGAFTGAQLTQLHRVTLARILCNNVPELEFIQRWPLRVPGPDNPRVCCKSIRQYNLDPWDPYYTEEEEEEEGQDGSHGEGNEDGCPDDNDDCFA